MINTAPERLARPGNIPAPDPLDWDDLPEAMGWRQGEHVLLTGPTGCGKTTVARELLRMRKYTCALVTKTRDSTIETFRESGMWVTHDWPTPSHHHRWTYVVPIDGVSYAAQQAQRALAARALANCYVRGNWTVYVDELNYLAESRNLDALLRLIWHGARSTGMSMMASAQRPRWLPVAALGQSTHLFIWQTRDQEDLRRIAGIGGMDSRLVAAQVADLPAGEGMEPSHDVLYVNTKSKRTYLTRAPKG